MSIEFWVYLFLNIYVIMYLFTYSLAKENGVEFVTKEWLIAMKKERDSVTFLGWYFFRPLIAIWLLPYDLVWHMVDFIWSLIVLIFMIIRWLPVLILGKLIIKDYEFKKEFIRIVKGNM